MGAIISEVFLWKFGERLPVSACDGYKYARRELIVVFGDTALFARHRRKKHAR